MRKLKSSKTKSTHFIRGSLPPEARDIRNALYPSQAVSRPPTLQEKLAAFIKIKKIPGTDWYKRHTHLTWCSGKECEPARKAAKAAQGKIPVVEERTEGTVPPDGLNLHGATPHSFSHFRKP
ncbi:hypothetical protein C8Q70DRAFT_263131 [Cubamyces menziesii]|nr:hypothetical protein C8Q70DRAFT_263131 [Cubamyces menziesii]